MASSNDTIKQTLIVAFLLCVVCSILVSGAAVILKPVQDANKILDRNKNILSAAGLFDPELHTDADVDELFAQFNPRVVDIERGRFLNDSEVAELGIDLTTYDTRRAINDPRYSRALASDEDVAKIKRQLLFPMVYVVESGDTIEQIVVPVSGYGLWGILYGFLALEGDGNTVTGIGFYELKETPGLGAEVTNPTWRDLWPGKKIYAGDGDVALRVVRGNGSGESQISGLAGATLTSRGVENLIQFWMGEAGFGPFLQNIRNG
ncbi:MAG: Na(+)-translocating NADH-quinone reductase subunit C [Gammaproteobacteria bacterium]|nr:Na(+)-translocating NADH-quinone reductase subunit C [Gammaproteobacteria bacterium]